MDVSAVVLNKVLSEKNLDVWAKLKLSFLDTAYSTLYSSIHRHYEKYSELPSFEDLELTIRNPSTIKILSTVKLLDTTEIDAEIAIDALVDRYTQDITVDLIDKFIDKITVCDTNEIKEELGNIALAIDEKTLTSENVFSMADILLFKEDDVNNSDRVYLGINNHFDATLSGVSKEELILIGGPRGSGKSLVSSNIAINQYENGNSVVYFTIEMKAHEIHERNFAILSEVPYMGLKNGALDPSQWEKVVRTRAGMFENSQDLVEEYLKHRDRFKFEKDLVKTKNLKKDNQIVIVDDRALTLSAIDLHLGKLKARFGDKLAVCVVDYLNQIVTDSGISVSQYDWQPQIVVSKKLKDMARKHNVVMVSPYQIDASGEARFAKGILDACDISLILDSESGKKEGIIKFNTTKIRSGPPIKMASRIDWETLRIHPENVEIEPPEKKSKKETTKTEETSRDVPW